LGETLPISEFLILALYINIFDHYFTHARGKWFYIKCWHAMAEGEYFLILNFP
jgi:hypothetical protein